MPKKRDPTKNQSNKERQEQTEQAIRNQKHTQNKTTHCLNKLDPTVKVETDQFFGSGGLVFHHENGLHGLPKKVASPEVTSRKRPVLAHEMHGVSVSIFRAGLVSLAAECQSEWWKMTLVIPSAIPRTTLSLYKTSRTARPEGNQQVGKTMPTPR